MGGNNLNDSFDILGDLSMGNFDDNRSALRTSGIQDGRKTAPQDASAPWGNGGNTGFQAGRSTSPAGPPIAQRTNGGFSQLNDQSGFKPYNPYAFPGEEGPKLNASAAPARVTGSDISEVRGSTLGAPTARDTQVTVTEQAAQIAALKHMVNDYERQLNDARVSASVRRSQVPGGNHMDTMKETLENYEKTINGLKADNLKYKGLEARVFQMEKEKKTLEDEIDKGRRIRSTLEAQLERWNGVEGSLPEWKTKCSKLEIENARYMNEIKRLRSENDFLSQQVREVEKKSAEIRKYEQEINTHILKIRDLEEDINFMREEKKALAANEKGRNASVYAELDALRERNQALERQMRDVNRDLQEGKAALSNSAMLNNKLKLAENENEGLKSMLALNQKVPKNMIFKDDVLPGVTEL